MRNILWRFYLWIRRLFAGDQAWFWTEEWQAGEAQADADIAAGRYTTYDNLEDFFADLEAASDYDYWALEDNE